MPDSTAPQSSIVLYQTEDGQTRIQCRFENETIWLTQKLMAELFKKDVRSINEHLQNVFAEGELVEEAVIRKFRITAADGKSYDIVRALAEPAMASLFDKDYSDCINAASTTACTAFGTSQQCTIPALPAACKGVVLF